MSHASMPVPVSPHFSFLTLENGMTILGSTEGMETEALRTWVKSQSITGLLMLMHRREGDIARQMAAEVLYGPSGKPPTDSSWGVARMTELLSQSSKGKAPPRTLPYPPAEAVTESDMPTPCEKSEIVSMTVDKPHERVWSYPYAHIDSTIPYKQKPVKEMNLELGRHGKTILLQRPSSMSYRDWIREKKKINAEYYQRMQKAHSLGLL